MRHRPAMTDTQAVRGVIHIASKPLVRKTVLVIVAAVAGHLFGQDIGLALREIFDIVTSSVIQA